MKIIFLFFIYHPGERWYSLDMCIDPLWIKCDWYLSVLYCSDSFTHQGKGSLINLYAVIFIFMFILYRKDLWEIINKQNSLFFFFLFVYVCPVRFYFSVLFAFFVFIFFFYYSEGYIVEVRQIKLTVNEDMSPHDVSMCTY